jgi:endonuclease/exonuclease/phosphatase family metal-dependent hydrolase
MRFLTYNVKSCQVAGLHAVADVIRAAGADVVALQEVARGQAEALAEELSMRSASGVTVRRLGYGNAVLSRAAIDRSEAWLYEPARRAEQRGGVLAIVQGVTVIATHLGLSVAERELQSRELKARLPSERLVVGADLNEEPGTVTSVLDLADAFVLAGAEPGATFPAHAPEHRIDYVLVSPDISVVSCAVLDAHASDHRPVLAELRI